MEEETAQHHQSADVYTPLEREMTVGLSARAGDDKSTRFNLLPLSLQHSHAPSSAQLRPVLTCRASSLWINAPTGLLASQRCGEESGNSSKVPESFINSWIRFRLQGTVHSLPVKQAGTSSPQIPMWSHQTTSLHLLP